MCVGDWVVAESVAHSPGCSGAVLVTVLGEASLCWSSDSAAIGADQARVGLEVSKEERITGVNLAEVLEEVSRGWA